MTLWQTPTLWDWLWVAGAMALIAVISVAIVAGFFALLGGPV